MGMNLFSFLNKEKALICAWCNKEMQTLRYTKSIGSKKYHFCSQSCKKSFRASGRGKKPKGCPMCKLS